jgi:hypothetical protein
MMKSALSVLIILSAFSAVEFSRVSESRFDRFAHQTLHIRQAGKYFPLPECF